MTPTLESLQIEFDFLSKQIRAMDEFDPERPKLIERRIGVRRRIIELRHEENKD